MYLGVADEIISGEGITKFGNEGSNIDFNNAGDNLPIAEVNNKVIDSYVSTDGFVYVYLENGYGTDSKYLQYKIPVDKVAFLNSNKSIPVGSEKVDMSHYLAWIKELKDFTYKRPMPEEPYMFNVNDDCFYNLYNSSNYNAKNILLASGVVNKEEIDASYSKMDGTIDFSFNLLGYGFSNMTENSNFTITSYDYCTYKEVTIAGQQFYSIIYHIVATNFNGTITDAYLEIMTAKDSVTIKAKESDLSLAA